MFKTSFSKRVYLRFLLMLNLILVYEMGSIRKCASAVELTADDGLPFALTTGGGFSLGYIVRIL